MIEIIHSDNYTTFDFVVKTKLESVAKCLSMGLKLNYDLKPAGPDSEWTAVTLGLSGIHKLSSLLSLCAKIKLGYPMGTPAVPTRTINGQFRYWIVENEDELEYALHASGGKMVLLEHWEPEPETILKRESRLFLMEIEPWETPVLKAFSEDSFRRQLQLIRKDIDGIFNSMQKFQTLTFVTQTPDIYVNKLPSSPLGLSIGDIFISTATKTDAGTEIVLRELVDKTESVPMVGIYTQLHHKGLPIPVDREPPQVVADMALLNDIVDFKLLVATKNLRPGPAPKPSQFPVYALISGLAIERYMDADNVTQEIMKKLTSIQDTRVKLQKQLSFIKETQNQQ